MGLSNLQQYASKSLFLLLLPAVIWLFLNASVNQHIHVLQNGNIISHAHPYEKTSSGSFPSETHHHTKSQLYWLSFISDPASQVITLFFLGLFYNTVFRILKIRYSHPEPVREYYQVNNYHAPPVS